MKRHGKWVCKMKRIRRMFAFKRFVMTHANRRERRVIHRLFRKFIRHQHKEHHGHDHRRRRWARKWSRRHHKNSRFINNTYIEPYMID